MDNKLEERLMACCPDWATLMLPARGPDDEPAEVQMRNLITEAADEITRLNALVDELVEGLEPFARVQDAAKRPDGERVRVIRPLSLDEIRERDEQGRVSSDGMTEILSFDGLTLADFRRARALITKASRDSGHG